MNLKEIYAAPRDRVWITYSRETVWTCAEILIGMIYSNKVDCLYRRKRNVLITYPQKT